MSWTVYVTMIPPSLHPFEFEILPECKAENQMRQLKDRIRERFALQVGEKVRLGYGKAGAIIEVSDDDSVDEVVEAIGQVYRQTLKFIE